jgi:hypothetical protein
MRNLKVLLCLTASCGLLVSPGCSSDDASVEGGETTDASASTGTTSSTTVTTTMTTAGPDSDTTGGMETGTTGDDTGTTGDDDTGTTGDDTGATGGETTGETGEDTGLPGCVDEDLGSAVPQSVNGNNAGGGNDVTPACGGGGGEDKVYQFTAPVDGWYAFDTFGSTFDTTLSAFTECGGAQLACNDDAAGTLQSRISLGLEAGQSVLLVVDSYAGDVGAFTLNITEGVEPPPPGGICDFSVGSILGSCAGSPAASSNSDTVGCDSIDNLSAVDIYEVDVQFGDCVYVSADNIDLQAGPTGMTAGDLFIVVRDPVSNYVFLDDEVPCSDPALGGWACPEGGIVSVANGTAQVGVGQWALSGCPNPSPYTLRIAVNGVDMDLSGGPLVQDQAQACSPFGPPMPPPPPP